jgi:glycosyltransferase involved in cell wall biosynthesis
VNIVEISVVVATYNRSNRLLATLHSLVKSQLPKDTHWEVIVVDNNSTDSTQSVVESFIKDNGSKFHYVVAPQQGKSFALNAGIRKATGKIIAMTDDDCIVDSAWIARIVAEFEADRDLAVMGGRVELYDLIDDPLTVRISRERKVLSRNPFEASFPSIIGCNMVVKREIFDVIGYFDQDLGPGSKHALISEDVDLIYRTCKREFKVIYSPEAVVYHNHGRRAGSDREAVRRNYARGRGAFYCKHIVRGDRAVLKYAYWEIVALIKQVVTQIFDGNLVSDSLRCLYGILSGAVCRFNEEILTLLQKPQSSVKTFAEKTTSVFS